MWLANSVEEFYKRANPMDDTRLKQIVVELQAMDGCDPEAAHARADWLMCEALRLLGAGDIADAFLDARNRLGFWYA